MTYWESLKTFKVETLTGTNKLFANGWQQVKLGITIEAVDINNTAAPLSAAEHASLKLYNYRDGKPLRFVTAQAAKSVVDRRQGHTDWSRTQDRKLKYYPGQESRMAGYSSSQNAAYIDVWVRTLSDEELRISAQITRDDGTTFSSSDMQEGEARLMPVPVPRYQVADFSWRKVNIVNRTEGSPRIIDYYYLNLRPGGVSVEMTEFTMSPKSLYANPFPQFNFLLANLTGHTAPGSSDIGYAINNARQRPATLVSPPGTGEVVLVLVRHTGRAATQDIVKLPEVKHAVMDIRDVYGNAHRLNVQSTDTLFLNDLELY